MAPLIKHVGRGARLARDLTREGAAEAMRMIAAGEADAVQIGGFLMAMRMKGEAPAELAGFVDALRPFADLPLSVDARTLDVDLHGDGREGRPSVTLAAACVAAACGARVVVRGVFDNRFAKNDVGAAFARLGIGGSRRGAARALEDAGVAVADLSTYAPRIAELLALREALGVRTCVNTAVKLLDPARTGRSLVGIFHGPYHAPVAQAARLLGVARAAVVQAPGGIPEPSPDRPTRVTYVDAAEPPAEAPVTLAPTTSAPAAPAATAEDLAAALDRVLGDPAGAPGGDVAMTLAAASLMLWVAGVAGDGAEPALRSGRAARVLDVMRVCYQS
jgi:anthranilate phosphoribosyltransferase